MPMEFYRHGKLRLPLLTTKQIFSFTKLVAGLSVCLFCYFQFRSEDQPTDDGQRIQSALNNALVLRQIFINFSTTELISTLSRVNKNWNFQARTFVRNFRNDCQANLSSSPSPSTCVLCVRLREFSDTVNSMNVVPFTSISIVKNCEGRNDCDDECKNYSPSAAINIVKRLKLKKLYMQLDHWDRLSCAATQYFVFLLLLEHSSQLETLRFRRAVPVLLQNILQSWTGELPELERIGWEMPPQELDRNRNFLETIFEGASKTLRFLRLGPGCLFEALEMFPEDKYCRVLDRFDLEIRNELVRRDQCLRVGRIGPALSELHVFDCQQDFKQGFLTVLGQLLRSSQQSLKSVRIRHLEMNFGDLFTSVQWPTLKTVKNFQLQTRGSYRQWVTTLQELIDYGRIFPSLEIVSLDHTCDDDQEYDAEHEWASDPVAVIHVSSSATKLELSLELGQVSLPQLKAMFPSVRFLQLENLSPSNLPALNQVFSLWPRLEQLVLTGDYNAEEKLLAEL